MADSDQLQNLRLELNFIFHVYIFKFDENKGPKRSRVGGVILRKCHFMLTVQLLKLKIWQFNFKMADFNRLHHLCLGLNFIFHVKIFKFDEIKVPKRCRVGGVILH